MTAADIRRNRGPEGVRHRLRLLAACLLLGAIAFNTAPGRMISETKLDMAVNPLGFLGRAVHLWDAAFFGHLQNQAYGYLFPMGPFYTLFHWLGMPEWNIQRLWMTLVLCTAFLGTVRLARALGIGSPDTRILGGLAYALAPHALALIGFNSSEFQPSAVLPWILLPLVLAARGALGPRRAAALSAVAFLFAGGVNAAAELAVLVVPALYLLTRRGPGRWRLTAWWLACMAAVSLWWLAPLLVMGRYIFSFLPFIETAEATTGVTSLLNTLRGTSGWMSFLPVDGRAWLPAAFEQATRPWLIAVTAAVAAAGLAGLVRRGTPERTFLALSVLVGVCVVTAGHGAAGDVLAFPWAAQVRELLDGPLAPFRNLHKFDALIRLPLALGLAALPLRRPSPQRARAVAVAAGLVGVSVLPVATAGVATPGSFPEIPSYWREAAAWLNANTGSGMVLAVPGSKRGEYVWGRPLDEPMQSLLTVRWATHSNVPWGSPGLARLLQAIDERFATGEGSPGLTAVLRRIGVKYLLVRNDLARETVGTAWPARVHQVLEDSTGLRRVAGFGPSVGSTSATTASGWFDQPYQALEVYEVPRAAPIAGTVPADGALRVAGAPEAVLSLAENGLLTDDTPVLIGDDPSAAPTRDTVVTDTLRRRGIVFGDLRRISGPTLEEDEPAGADLLDPAWEDAAVSARYLNVARITASSSDADVTAAGVYRDPGRQPYAAFDGDPRTGWRSDGWTGAVGQWLEVRFTEPIAPPAITVAFEVSALDPPVAEIALETEAGTRRAEVAPVTRPQRFVLPEGETSWLRIRVTRLAEEPRTVFGTRVGITEVAVPGLTPVRSLRVPDPPEGDGDAGTVLLTRQGDASACMRGSASWTCDQRLEILGEDGFGLDRTITVAEGGERAVSGRAVLTDPDSARALTTLPDLYPHVTASSTATDHPAVLGRAAMDGDVRTLWYAEPLDRRPTLDIDLGKTRRFSALWVVLPDSHLGTPPVRLTIRAGKRTVRAWVDRDGWARFPELRARRFTVEFTVPKSRALEVAEIVIPGVRPLSGMGGLPLRLPCGYGPTLRVDGEAVPTRVVDGTLDDVLNGRPVRYEGCSPVRLAPGTSRIHIAPTDPFRVESVVLRAGSADETGAKTGADARSRDAEDAGGSAADGDATTMRPVDIRSWGPQERRLAVSVAERSYLVVGENHNAGWQAYLDGKRLVPARLDGWRQAWVLPAGAEGTVVLRYEPDAAYRAALAAGGGLALAVVALAAIPGARGRIRLAAARPRPGVVWALPVAFAVGLWTGGWPGALSVAVLTLLFFRLVVAEGAAAVAAGGALVLAGLAGAAGAVTGADVLSGPVPQALCLLVLALLLAAVPSAAPPGEGASTAAARGTAAEGAREAEEARR